MALFTKSGGTALINGTSYSIKKGRTLVGGTGYDIEFASAAVVTITGSGNSSLPYSYVVINGVEYTSAATLEVPTGTVIKCVGYTVKSTTPGGVYVNDERKTTSTGVNTYYYTVTGNITIRLYCYNSSGPSSIKHGDVYITEE